MALRLTSAGTYREIKEQAGVLRSQALRGFWLRPEWLWLNPLPLIDQVLAQILAKPH